MRAEIAKTTRENKEFVRNVERAKALNGMQAKAAAKRKKTLGEEEEDGPAGDKEADMPQDAPGQQRRRTFKQIPLAKKRKLEEQPPEQVQRVLSKIF
jgi:ESF2/ABP1 family protein